MAETILLVDDEDSVRRTLYEWLKDADPDCELLQANDAESALRIASQRTIDLAILDWNLGGGHNGLQLLEDLRIFCPEVVAILVTGYAQQATPLDALRMGVRDYLDKSRDLRRETLLAIVRRQLAQIRPAKRQREHLARVQQFRQALESLLPMVQTTAELAHQVPFSESLQSLLRLTQALFQTEDGVLLVRQPPYSAMQKDLPGENVAFAPGQVAEEAMRPPAPTHTVFNLRGQMLQTNLPSFADTLAAATLAMQEICVLPDVAEAERRFGVRLQDYECGHRSLLAIPLPLDNGQAAVLELFDTPWAEGTWSDEQQAIIRSFQNLAQAVLSQVFAERQLHIALLRALQAALLSADQTQTRGSTKEQASSLDWQAMLVQSSVLPDFPQELHQLAEQLHVLYRKYGPAALEFSRQLLQDLQRFLSQVLEPPSLSDK